MSTLTMLVDFTGQLVSNTSRVPGLNIRHLWKDTHRACCWSNVIFFKINPGESNNTRHARVPTSRTVILSRMPSLRLTWVWAFYMWKYCRYIHFSFFKLFFFNLVNSVTLFFQPPYPDVFIARR